MHASDTASIIRIAKGMELREKLVGILLSQQLSAADKKVHLQDPVSCLVPAQTPLDSSVEW